jgi:hypothetical protein
MTAPATPDAPRKRLLASIHDVSPVSRARSMLAERLSGHLGTGNFAMLVIPDHWRGAPLAGNAAFQRRLRGWADMGIEMFLHGWCHKDETPADQGLAGFKGKHMTAGEGEFLNLPRAGGRAHARGQGPGGRCAGPPGDRFHRAGLALWRRRPRGHVRGGLCPGRRPHESLAPGRRQVLAKGPVITWASRSKARIASSLWFSALARQALPALRTVRVAVHPGDTTVPALLASIDSTLARFARSHVPSRYASLTGLERAGLSEASHGARPDRCAS